MLKLNSYVYQIGLCKEDLHSCINLSDFDRTRISLKENDVNPNNFNVLYDGQKFRLFVKKMFGRVKKSRCFEDTDYLNFKYDCSVRDVLYEVFNTIKEQVIARVKSCSFIEWKKLWLGCFEYDLTEKHLYTFEDICIAADSVVLIDDQNFKNYRYDIEMIKGNVRLCPKCDTFLL